MSHPAVPLNDEDRLLVRHILDLAKRSEQSYRPLFSTFLDERQLALCEVALKSNKVENFVTFGGYDNSERRVIAFGATDEANIAWPFQAVVFSYTDSADLTHRDFLGCIMSLGIKRELIGDILVGKGRTAVFVVDVAVPLVTELTKVGRCGVKVQFDFTDADIPTQQFDEIRTTVASLRLDSIIASGLRLSRDKAAELIKSKGVMHNRVMTFSPDERVEEGDRFSVRGFGRMDLSEVGERSKKDRLFITIRKYR